MRTLSSEMDWGFFYAMEDGAMGDGSHGGREPWGVNGRLKLSHFRS